MLVTALYKFESGFLFFIYLLLHMNIYIYILCIYFIYIYIAELGSFASVLQIYVILMLRRQSQTCVSSKITQNLLSFGQCNFLPYSPEKNKNKKLIAKKFTVQYFKVLNFVSKPVKSYQNLKIILNFQKGSSLIIALECSWLLVGQFSLHSTPG